MGHNTEYLGNLSKLNNTMQIHSGTMLNSECRAGKMRRSMPAERADAMLPILQGVAGKPFGYEMNNNE